MGTHSYIEINPRIMMGKPVIKGTRITVELILEKLSVVNSIEKYFNHILILQKNKYMLLWLLRPIQFAGMKFILLLYENISR